MGRLATAYLAVAVLLLIGGELMGGGAGSGLFLAGGILIGAFLPLVFVHYLARGIFRIG